VAAVVLVVVERPIKELVTITNILMIANKDQGAFLVIIENTLKLIGNLLQILNPLSLEEL